MTLAISVPGTPLFDNVATTRICSSVRSAIETFGMLAVPKRSRMCGCRELFAYTTDEVDGVGTGITVSSLSAANWLFCNTDVIPLGCVTGELGRRGVGITNG